MNKITILLLASMIIAERVNYWHLGISINKETHRTVQKTVDIDGFFAETALKPAGDDFFLINTLSLEWPYNESIHVCLHSDYPSASLLT